MFGSSEQPLRAKEYCDEISNGCKGDYHVGVPPLYSRTGSTLPLLQKMSVEDKKALKLLSDYANSLDPIVKARYLKEISCIGLDYLGISGPD